VNCRPMRKIPIIFISFFLLSSCEKQNSILRDYVHKEDNAFQYEIKNVVEGESWKEYIIKMVSQKWLTSNEVNQVQWWHWLTVIIPNEVEETEALLVIGGGNNKTMLPESADPALVQAALATKSIIAEMSNIPFQPVVYKNDDFGERVEDELISFGWRQFLEGGAQDKDAKWLARLPMTKAVSRGMDVVQEIAENEGKPVQQFVTTGASKRGWTTWCTAIADDRVMAIIPIVIDMLNVVPSFNHHWKCYGEWSPAVEDYVNEGVMDWMGSREFAGLMEIVEPYSFIDELDLPKFLINATGDEFFVTDSWQFYWDDLTGDKYLQYIPNTNHSLRNLEGDYDLRSLLAFYKAVISDSELPKFDWLVKGDSIFLNIDHSFNSDYQLKQWKAVNENGRDFRIWAIDRSWTSTDIPKNENGKYGVVVGKPEKGYICGLLEITFNPDSDLPFTFTTGTVVAPNTFPFDDFVSKKPLGTR